jgi:hypothetical protein
MGIGPTALKLYVDLARCNVMHAGQSVCELGAQDLMPEDFNLMQLLEAYNTRLYRAQEAASGRDLFNILGCTYECIDLEDRYSALPIDLNHAKLLPGQHILFNVVTNLGTSEHIFNQANCFQIIHDLCAVQGIMIHVVPHAGEEQKSHGMFCYSDGFFNDLALANKYEVIRHYVDEYKPGAGHSVVAVLRKEHDRPLVYPIQGCYSYLEHKAWTGSSTP